MSFSSWIDTLVEEKNIDLEEMFSVEGSSGTNFMDLHNVVAHMKIAPPKEQEAIKNTIVKLDFYNQPIVPYFKHLAQALAV